MKFLVAVFLFFTSLFANLSLQTQINKAKTQINKKKVKKRTIQETLAILEKRISQINKDLNEYDLKISKLSKKIEEYKQKHKKKIQRLKSLTTTYTLLKQKEQTINKKLMKILAKQVKLKILLEQTSNLNPYEKEIKRKIYQKYSSILRNSFTEEKRKLLDIQLKISSLKEAIDDTRGKIKDYEDAKEKLEKLIKAKKNLLAESIRSRKKYKKLFIQNQKELARLSKYLRSLLNLKKEDEKRKEILKAKDNIKIRVKSNISYDLSKMALKPNIKTIAPFDHYQVIQKFGTHINPITKVKESSDVLILKPIGSKYVKNIFKGKVDVVSYGGWNKNTVVIHADNGYVVIYSNLDSVSKVVKKGKIIPKNTIIGKANDKLVLQVIKGNKPVNINDLFY